MTELQGHKKNKLSAILIVWNEENKIRRSLESVRWADEIVVVDQSSTDKTAEICREYTDRIFTVPNKGYADLDYAFAVSKCSNDWMLLVDADETVTPELRDEIKSLLASGPAKDCYYIPRKNMFLGKWIKSSGWYPGHVLRLFRKSSIKYPEEIHVCLRPMSAFGYLKNHIVHNTYENMAEYVKRFDRYTTILAREASKKGEKVDAKNFIWKLFLLPVAYFLQKYFLKLGITDGIYGLLIAGLTFFTVFTKNAKLWEMKDGGGPV